MTQAVNVAAKIKIYYDGTVHKGDQLIKMLTEPHKIT